MPFSATPAGRARARQAALLRHGRSNGTESTEAARRAFERRFNDQIDDQLWLDNPAEAARRAACLRKAYFTGLSAQSLEARSKKKQRIDRRARALSLSG